MKAHENNNHHAVFEVIKTQKNRCLKIYFKMKMHIPMKISFWYHLQMLSGRDICMVPGNRGQTPTYTC